MAAAATTSTPKITVEFQPEKPEIVVSEKKDKISVVDIYHRLCECRDLEIKLQWERAVFLTAFLLATFTAYGKVLDWYFGGSGAHSFGAYKMNGMAIAISIVGIVFSILWILMAKGSKAWYEHYERVIEAFATLSCGQSPDREKNSSDAPTSSIEQCVPEGWGTIVGGTMRQFTGLVHDKLNSSLWRFCGGTFSVSKIVIAIGWVFLGCWGVIFLVHFVCLVECIFGHALWEKISLMLLPIAALLALGLFAFVLKFVRSGYLRKLREGVSEKEDK